MDLEVEDQLGGFDSSHSFIRRVRSCSIQFLVSSAKHSSRRLSYCQRVVKELAMESATEWHVTITAARLVLDRKLTTASCYSAGGRQFLI